MSVARARFILPALVLVAQVGLIAVWLINTQEFELRRQLSYLQFWILEIQFLLLAGLTWINAPRLLKSLQLTRRSVMGVAATSALALALVLFVTPTTNRLFYDEHVYQGIAQNMSDLHRAQMCNEGVVEYGSLQCSRAEYNKEPYGYPYMVSLAYRIVGVHAGVANNLNALCAAALVLIVFLVACCLFDQRAGLFAGLVAALIPQQLLWSHTAAVEPSAALMCAFALLTALHYARTPSTASLLWMTSASAFAVQFRAEAFLVLIAVALVLLLSARDSFTRVAFWWAMSLGVALCAVHFAHLFSVRNESWGSSGSRMSLQVLWPNLQVNGPFYFNNARFPALFSILALSAAVWRASKAVAVPIVMFLAFWSVYLFFYAGSYEYGADVRFSLMTYPALAILAGQGAAALCRVAENRGVSLRTAAAGLVTLVLVQFLLFAPQVRAIGEEAWAARADAAFAERVARELPPNSMVLTHIPAIFHLSGVNAAQMSLATTDSAYVASQFPQRFSGGIYLHWNAWCNYNDSVQIAFCTQSLARFQSRLLKEYRERGYRYAIYRLKIND